MLSEQMKMFDVPKRDKEPGELDFDTWLDTQKPVYHGTFREDWGNAPTSHYGTIGTAAKRLDDVKRYMGQGRFARRNYLDPASSVYPEDEHDSSEPETPLTGRVYARRMTGVRPANPVSDADANTIDYGYRLQHHDEDEIPGSIKDSVITAPIYDDDEDRVRWPSNRPTGFYERKAADLDEGHPISYRNSAESGGLVDKELGVESGDISYVASRGGVSSWERDVLNAKHASPIARDIAQRRIASGKEGAVPIPQFGRAGQQGKLFGGGAHTFTTHEGESKTETTGYYYHDDERGLGPKPESVGRGIRYVNEVQFNPEDL